MVDHCCKSLVLKGSYATFLYEDTSASSTSITFDINRMFAASSNALSKQFYTQYAYAYILPLISWRMSSECCLLQSLDVLR